MIEEWKKRSRVRWDAIAGCNGRAERTASEPLLEMGTAQFSCGRDVPRSSYTRCGSGQSLCESAVESSMGFGHALRLPATSSSVALRVLAVDFPCEMVSSAPEHCDASCDE